MIQIGIFAIAVVVSAALTRLVRDQANILGWVAKTDSPRHVHLKPVPRLGGLAILGALVAAVTTAAVAVNWLHYSESVPARMFLGLLGPTLLIFALGLIDDFRPLSPYLKFAVQILAAGWLFLDGCRVSRFQLFFGDRQIGNVASFCLTVFWVLLITNAFNLLDGLDGLAAGSALFSSLVVFAVSLGTGNVFAEVVTIALAGAIVGFLRYNFNPATIFLGDCGSLTIGFVLSAVSLASSQKTSTAVAVAIPVVSFGLPILDTSIAVVRRFLNRKPLFAADDEHIHHKLLQRGLSHRQAVVVLYSVSACFALVSLPLLSQRSGNTVVVLIVVGLGVFWGLQHLGYHEVDELRRMARRTLEQKTIISNNLAIRRAARQLAAATMFDDIIAILNAAFQDNEYDGFELSGGVDSLLTGELPVSGALRYSWQKDSRRRSKGWEIRLELLSSTGEICGIFSTHRSYENASLRGDVDCLTEELAPALGAALERIGKNQMISIPMSSGYADSANVA